MPVVASRIISFDASSVMPFTANNKAVPPFVPTAEYYSVREQDLSGVSYNDVCNIIHRGSMPELTENLDFDWQMFYSAYVRTHIDFDIRELSEIGDTV